MRHIFSRPVSLHKIIPFTNINQTLKPQQLGDHHPVYIDFHCKMSPFTSPISCFHFQAVFDNHNWQINMRGLGSFPGNLLVSYVVNDYLLVIHSKISAEWKNTFVTRSRDWVACPRFSIFRFLHHFLATQNTTLICKPN